MSEKRCKICQAKVEEEFNDLCNYCIEQNNNWKDRKPSNKKVEITPQKKESDGYITVTCSICKKVCKVRTTQKELYTEEVKKTWTCLLCDTKKNIHNRKET
jgi:hypothetical protein